MVILFFALGLAFMVVGAEFLVRGASRLAVMAGVSPLVVGLTVVAFGTSAPEFAVSFEAALNDQASLSVGNVVGSNIFNGLFILGVSALIVPLIVARQLIRFDVPLLIAISAAVLALGLDGKFSRTDGLLLFSGLVVYTVGLIVVSYRRGNAVPDEETAELISETKGRSPLVRLLRHIAYIIGGLVLLVLGARWLVDTAVTFARWMEVSELVIGLTIVSIGTSLPEVVTSLVASIKGERDIAVGNVIGSNLFNIMGVLGLASAVAPSGLAVDPSLLRFDIPVMIGVALIALPIFFTGGVISRWEGVVLLSYYVVYTVYLIMDASDDPRLEPFGQAILYIAIPITTLVLATISIRCFLAKTPVATST